MRIIENKCQNKDREYEITCLHCRSRLAYTLNDIVSDEFEREYLYCGACGKGMCLDGGLPTVKTIQYPKDFFSYADCVPIKNTEIINQWVQECINDFDNGRTWSLRASGDTLVFAYRSDIEVEDINVPAYKKVTVIVAKKYQSADVKISQKIF